MGILMDFFRDEPVIMPRPKVGALVTFMIDGQERHGIVTAIHDQPDGSFVVDIRPDPTEPPIT